MPRVALDLNKQEDSQKVNGTWRRALGLVPGEPNQGLVAELEASPARLADYDDSAWEVTGNVRDLVSKGFTFGWWRITVELPARDRRACRSQAPTCCSRRTSITTARSGSTATSTSSPVPWSALTRSNGSWSAPVRAGREARHRLPCRERTDGAAARRHLHALRHAGVRNEGLRTCPRLADAPEERVAVVGVGKADSGACAVHQLVSAATAARGNGDADGGAWRRSGESRLSGAQLALQLQ